VIRLGDTDKHPDSHFELSQLGWDASRQEELNTVADADLLPARVATAVRGRYRVIGLGGVRAELAASRSRIAHVEGEVYPYPVVGDWVLVRRERNAIAIERLLSRRSSFVRKAAGRDARPQVIAANIDRVLIVTAVDRDFNPRRIERYLATVWEGGAEPVIVVNKTDLPHDRAEVMGELETIACGVPVVMSCAEDERGLEDVFPLCQPGKTIALVGSSGVGKSTIINRLVGAERQSTAPVRDGDHKGRHQTTRQELIVTPLGAILIDTAGLRELGLWDAQRGVERAFADIEEIAQRCRFRDCRHAGEPGCAVNAAVEDGTLDRRRLEGYHRLQRELEHQERRASARSGGNSKRRWKEISKLVRQHYRSKKEP
jgi:ribosome biogenesis GTPase